MTLIVANNVSSSIDWNNEPPKKVSIENFIEMEAEILAENHTTSEVWYRHYAEAIGWDYYCSKNQCCYIGSDTQKVEDIFSHKCKE